MRKRVLGRKFSRDYGARKALIRSLIRSLVLYGKITTTRAKAKTLQRQVDKLMSIVRKDNLVARRKVMAKLGNDREISKKLFGEFLELAKSRTGGFTTLINLTPRFGDRAQMARVEWVKIPEKKKTREAGKARKSSPRGKRK